MGSAYPRSDSVANDWNPVHVGWSKEAGGLRYNKMLHDATLLARVRRRHKCHKLRRTATCFG